MQLESSSLLGAGGCLGLLLWPSETDFHVAPFAVLVLFPVVPLLRSGVESLVANFALNCFSILWWTLKTDVLRAVCLFWAECGLVCALVCEEVVGVEELETLEGENSLEGQDSFEELAVLGLLLLLVVRLVEC